MPASYHNNAGNISFADGHCETHKWRGIAMTSKVEYRERRRLPDSLDQRSQEDYRWLAERASIPAAPSAQ
jgi:prepilin-type processing-associated H-X9-DG protein